MTRPTNSSNPVGSFMLKRLSGDVNKVLALPYLFPYTRPYCTCASDRHLNFGRQSFLYLFAERNVNGRFSLSGKRQFAAHFCIISAADIDAAETFDGHLFSDS